MINKSFLVFLAFLFSVSAFSQHGRSGGMISGRVISTVEKEVVDCDCISERDEQRSDYR